MLIMTILACDLATGQTCYLFVGSYNFNKKKEGVYVYRFDTLTGQLEKVFSTKGIANPSFITLSPDGKHLYACTESLTKNAGSVSAFSIDSSTGSLSFINSRPSGGENPVYLSVDKTNKWLVNANYTEGSVSVYPLSSDGSIDSATQVIPFEEGSINRVRQQSAHIHSAVFSPSQDYLFLPDLGADKIRCCSFDHLNQHPLSTTAHAFTKSVAGSGPRHFAFHPNGHFAYCIEEMGGAINAYAYKDGQLDSIQRIPAHLKEQNRDFSSADIHLSADGRFLYASNRAKENNLAIFSVDANSGLLTLVAYQSTLGDHPRNFTIDPTGKFLLVANQFSGNVVVFKRDISTGLLTDTGIQISLPNPSCLQFRNYRN